MSLKKRLLSILISLTVIFQIFLFCVPQATALTSAQIEANKQTVYKYLTENMGYNTAAACGVLANIEKESYFDPNCTGDGGTSYGICQWHSDRWTNLKNYCNSNGYDWKSITGQLHFLKYELTNSDPYYRNTVHAKLLSVENTANGAYDAAYAWCYYFEIPENKEVKSKERGELAKTAYWPQFYTPPVETPTVVDKLSVLVSDIIVRIGDTYTIAPQITSTAGVKSITYNSSDEKIVKVDSNGNVTTVDTGEAEITCTVTDKNGNKASDTCKVTVTINWWEKIVLILNQVWELICSILNI